MRNWRGRILVPGQRAGCPHPVSSYRAPDAGSSPGSVPVAGRPAHGHPGLELNWARAELGLFVTAQPPGQSPGSSAGVPPVPCTGMPEPQGPGRMRGVRLPRSPWPHCLPPAASTTKAAMLVGSAMRETPVVLMPPLDACRLMNQPSLLTAVPEDPLAVLTAAAGSETAAWVRILFKYL